MTNKILTDNERLDWLRLSRSQSIGPITFHKLLARYKTAAAALNALPELHSKGGARKDLRIVTKAEAEKELSALHKYGGNLIAACEKSYPLPLAAIDDAPPVISFIGDAKILNQSCIGVVGARNASLNARKFTEKLARNLGENNHIIASGLARGIDTSAHKGSLKTGTVAVVAGGIDVIYPRENEQLYSDIIENGGAIIAENKFGTQPTAQHFPRRNRIVSGLSAGVVVIEASIRSGSLITARLANEQGRDVFAVPGFPGDPRSAGPNKLLKDGAILIERAEDILGHVESFVTKAIPNGLFEDISVQEDWQIESEETDDNSRGNVVSLLSHQPVSVDEIVRTCHLSISGVQTILLELELAGRIERLPGNRVSLIG